MQAETTKSVGDSPRYALEKVKSLVDELSLAYADCLSTRIATSILPGIGGMLDVALMHMAAKNQQERIDKVLKKMADEVSRLHEASVDYNDPEFTDYVMDIVDKARSARTESKLDRFAKVFSGQCESPEPWDEAFMVNRLVDELDDLHIAILHKATSVEARRIGASEDVIKVIAIDTHGIEGIYDLTSLLPEYSKESLVVGCSELIARGLLLDETANRANSYRMEWFTPTELAYWLQSKLS